MDRSISPTTLLHTFRHNLHCNVINEDFVIDVAPPLEDTSTPLPVVYVLDGNLMFPMVLGTVRLLQQSKELPPFILVGVGYANETQVMSLRTRDLTPTHDPNYYSLAEREGFTLPADIKPGGADSFLQFLLDQVMPLVQGAYPTQADSNTLIGDSLGGLFALYTLFNKPQAFQHYLVGSPSLWWDSGVMFKQEAGLAQSRHKLAARLFMSVGGLEEPAEGPGSWAKMVTNMHAMATLLSPEKYPSLRVTTHEFPGETHLSVIPATFSRGLREIFSEDGSDEFC